MKYKVNFQLDFKRNIYNGRYIVFEGIDAAGKTLQAEKITKLLKSQKRDVFNVHEPTRTDAIGEIIHKFLKGKTRIPPFAVQHLYVADRIYQLENLTIPLLKKGTFVVSQRCFWSSVPYGMIDRANGKIDFNSAENLLVSLSILSMYNQVLAPDITVYLKVSAKTAFDRLKKIDGHEYYDKLPLLEQLVKGYDFLAEKFPNEFIIVDGEQNEEKVTKDIIKGLKSKGLL